MDVPFGRRSARVKMFSGRSVGGRSVKAPLQHIRPQFTLSRPLTDRVDMKWHFQFFAKYDYRFLLAVIISIIATFLLKQSSLFFNYSKVFCMSDNRDYPNNNMK